MVETSSATSVPAGAADGSNRALSGVDRTAGDTIPKRSRRQPHSLTGTAATPGFRIACGLALVWYFSSFFVPIHVSWHGRDLIINAYSGAYLIPLFGLYLYRKESDPYQKRRLLWIVGLYELLWVVIPAILGFREVVPQLDGSYRVFPAIHYIESLAFFLYFLPVFFMGRRADCGWCCPCVAARETFAAGFRDKTLKGDQWWWLRYLKWVNVAAVLVYLVAVIRMPGAAQNVYGKPLYAYLLGFYYLSFLLIPWTGSRNFCRWGCPWGGIWGVLGYMGLHRIRARADLCTGCGLCEKVCDMGIPIQRLVREKGAIRTPECMGCGRCVAVCPAGALSFRKPGVRESERAEPIIVASSERPNPRGTS